ncbi:hypothetical protein RhiirA5_368339 [Rhizophagus irregularis]|uniref:Uncharacterized protein n=2 Tax=Rhizophagus irregularis TaxID=588596 RepID=A0A2I1FAL5_9GLOM|nr:hypothetical protein RhiirA5_368339 [Rhizophagus irregularis]PKC55975.1 hypothetical protein RhiirA1_429347 [Rhizophagus irregularis]PKY31414.1 hypothetical protein RhiirB3_419500 [Rhizophagus irregularis]GBC16484.1 bromodomain-containing protein [Rhizophagus irregularis DAOM 181602=DAOM 197198]
MNNINVISGSVSGRRCRSGRSRVRKILLRSGRYYYRAEKNIVSTGQPAVIPGRVRQGVSGKYPFLF